MLCPESVNERTAFSSKNAKQNACYPSNVGNFNIVLIYEIQKHMFSKLYMQPINPEAYIIVVYEAS